MYRLNTLKTLAAPIALHAVLPTTLLVVSSVANAESSLEASFRLGVGFLDNDVTSADFSVQSDESEIRFNHSSEINSGLMAIANLELELTPENISDESSGIGRTREAWVGIEGGFGTFTVGTQFSAFYDIVSKATDLSRSTTCLTQLRCDEDSNIIKYSGGSGSFTYNSSIRALEGDGGNDLIDELEGGVSFNAGAISIGLASSFRASEGNRSSGILIGGVASATFNDVNLALGLQIADSDYTGFRDTSTQATFSAQFNNVYAVLNIANGLDSDGGNYGSFGYTRQLNDNASMNFEGVIADGGDRLGTSIALLATFQYDFDFL